MRKLLILLCITMVGCGTKYRVIHKPLFIPEQCIFEKFTQLEINSMIEEVGKKIARNQDNCRIRQVRINALIEAHNQAHDK